MERSPELGGQLRVIHRSPPFGIPSAVVGPGVRPQLKADLREVLLGMSRDSAGQAALATAGIDRFVVAEDAAYDSVRDVVHAVGAEVP